MLIKISKARARKGCETKHDRSAPVDGVRETTQAVAAVLVVQACPCPTAPSSLPVCLLNAISSRLSLAMMIFTATNVVVLLLLRLPLLSSLSLVAQRVWVSGEDVEESEKMSLGKERV